MSLRHESRTSPGLSGDVKRQVRSMALITVLSLLCTMVSAIHWFGGDENLALTISNSSYAARVEIVKDSSGLHSGENLLWYGNDLRFCDQVISLEQQVQKATVLVSNLSNSTQSMGYRLRVSEVASDGSEQLLHEIVNTPVLTPGQTGLPQNIQCSPGATLRVQVFTAPEGADIATAAAAEDLLQAKDDAGSVVYLTRDITVDGPLTFRERYPNINLAGHTLKVKELTVYADSGVYGDMCIENGTLVVGETAYTDGQAIACSGEGNIVITLRDLK